MNPHLEACEPAPARAVIANRSNLDTTNWCSASTWVTHHFKRVAPECHGTTKKIRGDLDNFIDKEV
jgi:hypothetical protein